jgi:nucleoside-diphosphate-sugar epimerase
MKQISILGCGWLGLPLAKSLLEKGFSVKGSTTSLRKVFTLKQAGIDAFKIVVSGSGIDGNMHSFLENSEILIIDIPPKIRGNSTENFAKKIGKLIPFIKEAEIKKVIFISSTAVYNDDYSTVTETTQTNPDSESGKQLVAAEKLLFLNMFDFSTTKIRFGGLIGEDRHPVYHLAGKQNLGNPGAAVNLIHQVDCIGIIEKVIELDCWNQTFNAVAPFHPSRKEYYTQKAAEFNLPLPEFSENPTSFGKIIHANMVESELHYKFQKPTL